MSLYIFVLRGIGAIVDVPGETSSKEWGKLYREFTSHVYKQQTKADENWMWVTCERLWPDQCRNNVYWSEELAGPDGISVQFYPLPPGTREGYKDTKAYVKFNHDVVRTSVVNVKMWLPLWSMRFQVPVATAVAAARQPACISTIT